LFIGILGYMIGHLPKRSASEGHGVVVPARNGPDHFDEFEIKTAIARLEQRIELLELKQTIPTNQSPSATVPKESQAQFDRNDLEDKSARHSNEISEEIESKLKTERRDRSWSSETEDNIRSAAKTVAGEGGKFSFASLSCLTSLCKAELSLPNLTGPQGTMYSFPFSVPNMAGFQNTQPVQRADGTYKIEYTFFRKGYPVPGQEQTM